MVFPVRSVHGWHTAPSVFLDVPIFFFFWNLEAIMTVLSKASRSQSLSCQQSFSHISQGEEDIPWEAFRVSPVSFYLQGLPKLVHLTCFSVVSSEHMVAAEPWGKCLYFTCKAAAEPCNAETPSLPCCCSCKPCVVFHLSHLLLFHPETWKRSLLTLISPIRVPTNLFFFFLFFPL